MERLAVASVCGRRVDGGGPDARDRPPARRPWPAPAVGRGPPPGRLAAVASRPLPLSDGAALPSASQARTALTARDRAERERHPAMLASGAAQIRAVLGPAETASDPGPEQEPADAAAHAARIRDELGWRKQ